MIPFSVILFQHLVLGKSQAGFLRPFTRMNAKGFNTLSQYHDGTKYRAKPDSKLVLPESNSFLAGLNSFLPGLNSFLVESNSFPARLNSFLAAWNSDPADRNSTLPGTDFILAGSNSYLAGSSWSWGGENLLPRGLRLGVGAPGNRGPLYLSVSPASTAGPLALASQSGS